MRAADFLDFLLMNCAIGRDGVMEREVFMVRNGAVIWRNRVRPPLKNGVASAQEYFEEAWRRALSDGAVSDGDAGHVQFRTTAP
jgi:hypothetical protein